MRILLAEDEKPLSKALVTILKHNNYSVDAVYNGQEALDYLLSDIYDAAILDIMMPKMDGITVLKTIRAKGISVPVLLLTAKSEIDDRVEGLDCGADDYMTKPFAMKELLARLRVMTRRQAEGRVEESVLSFCDIRLNRTNFELSTKDGSLHLGNKEFQMLEMLMLHPMQMISAERFMEKIWGFDSDAELNVVWVYLSKLRKKLLQVNAHVQIKAARNLGYYLEVSDD